MVTTKLNLSMTEPQVRQIYAKQGDTGRVLDITLDQTPEDGTLRILRPDGVEVTSEAVTGGEVESGSTFESLTEADVTELTVGIEPVQDLNGYDKPWVGGAGKNKLPYPYYDSTKTVNGVTFTVKADGTVVANGTATGLINFTLNNTLTLSGNYILSGCPSGGSAGTYRMDCYWSGQGALIDSGSGVAISPNGNAITTRIVVFQGATLNNATFYPMIRLATETDTWQPYSNICPITGHDGVTVFDTAEQMYDPSQVVIGRNWTGGSADNRAVFEFVPTPNISYEIVTMGGNFSNILFLQMNGGSILSNTEILPSMTPKTVTIADNCNRVIIQFNKDSAITTADFLVFECSVSTKTNTYTTSLGQTVYGGTLDMVSGVLTVDKVGFAPQLSTFNSITHYQSNFNSTNGIVSVRIGNGYLSNLGIDTTATTLKAKTISTLAPVFSGQAWNNTDAVGKMGVVDGLVFDYHYSTIGLSEWTTDGSTTVNAFYNTFGSSLFIVAPLATPQTIQLTPQQIKTLVGTNNVWASSGDIVNITFTYGGLLSELPSEATEIVGKCYCDVEQNGVSSMPFTLNVKKNERQ